MFQSRHREAGQRTPGSSGEVLRRALERFNRAIAKLASEPWTTTVPIVSPVSSVSIAPSRSWPANQSTFIGLLKRCSTCFNRAIAKLASEPRLSFASKVCLPSLFQSRHREAGQRTGATASPQTTHKEVSIAPSRSWPANRVTVRTSTSREPRCFNRAIAKLASEPVVQRQDLGHSGWSDVSIAPSRSWPANQCASMSAMIEERERFNRAIAKLASEPCLDQTG